MPEQGIQSGVDLASESQKTPSQARRRDQETGPDRKDQVEGMKKWTFHRTPPFEGALGMPEASGSPGPICPSGVGLGLGPDIPQPIVITVRRSGRRKRRIDIAGRSHQ
jgi:hypothetical protein